MICDTCKKQLRNRQECYRFKITLEDDIFYKYGCSLEHELELEAKYYGMIAEVLLK